MVERESAEGELECMVGENKMVGSAERRNAMIGDGLDLST